MPRQILVRIVVVIIAGAAFIPTLIRGSDEDGVPAPKYPEWAQEKGEQGDVSVTVVFGFDGEVTHCTIAKSTGFSDLDDYTVDFIRKNWHAPKFAGKKVIVPVDYVLKAGDRRVELPEGRVVRDFVPHNLGWAEVKTDVLVRCRCGVGGTVLETSIIKSSGSAAIDRAAMVWVRKESHDPANANRVVDLPLTYDHFTATSRF